MIAIIKEIGIFIVIAQAILYFVPGENYVKYVKVLVGIMMMAKLISPVLSLFSGQVFDETIWEEKAYFADARVLEQEIIERENYKKIYAEIGKELQEKLNQSPLEGYEVEKVLIQEKNKEEYQISLVVDAPNQGNVSEEELKAYYEQVLQTENLLLQIR